MKARVFAGLLLAGAAGAASASSYSDFNAAIAAHNRGDWDETIRRATLALNAPDLLPAFRAPAAIDRGDAHAAKKDWDLAIADYGTALAAAPGGVEARLSRASVYREQKKFPAAIADMGEIIRLKPSWGVGYEGRGILYEESENLDGAIADYGTLIDLYPKLAEGYVLRGNVWRHKRDYDKALEDLNQAVDVDGKSDEVYFDRAQIYQDQGDYRRAIGDDKDGLERNAGNVDGRMGLGLAQWAYGRFSDAATSFAQVVQARPAIAYGVLWRALSQARAGAAYDSEFAQNATKLDVVKWPAPVVKLYLGQSTPEAALKAADNPDPETAKNQICEANFYIGEWQLIHANAAAAAPMLQAARDNCIFDFVERDAAIAELGRTK
jgi:lipoprotein NlpI